MYRLPADCTADQALAIVREHDRLEEIRLLCEYPPAEWDGDANDWPGWTDAEVWELGPGPEDEPPFEPSESDREWLAPQDLADELEAWTEYREWAEHVERSNPLTDADLIASGLPVG